MSAVEWEEPPRSHGGPGSLFTVEVREALRSRPGEWACIKRSHTNASAATTFAQRNPEFEVTSRRNPDKTFDLYARYVGEQS